jgi:hypothetical protein
MNKTALGLISIGVLAGVIGAIALQPGTAGAAKDFDTPITDATTKGLAVKCVHICTDETRVDVALVRSDATEVPQTLRATATECQGVRAKSGGGVEVFTKVDTDCAANIAKASEVEGTNAVKLDAVAAALDTAKLVPGTK